MHLDSDLRREGIRQGYAPKKSNLALLFYLLFPILLISILDRNVRVNG